MKLITELNENVSYFTEANESGKKYHCIEGVFMVAAERNKNGRIYPESVLANEVNRYNEEVVKTKRAFGELNHPSGPTINLDKVSHLITNIHKEGTKFIGKARIAETPMGSIVRGLLETGAQLGVSSRALGSLKESKGGIMEVQPDLRLITVDIVADPSAPGAFVEGIMENAEWIFNESTGEWVQERAHNLRNKIRSMSLDEVQNKRVQMFESFIAGLTAKDS